jgi:hypothetical protein
VSRFAVVKATELQSTNAKIKTGNRRRFLIVTLADIGRAIDFCLCLQKETALDERAKRKKERKKEI